MTESGFVTIEEITGLCQQRTWHKYNLDICYFENMSITRLNTLFNTSRLVDSVISGIPFGTIFIDSSDLDKSILGNSKIINGFNRIAAIKKFVRNEFPLKGMFFNKQYEGLYFEELPEELRQFIKTTKVSIVNILPNTDNATRLELIARFTNSNSQTNL